MLGRQVRMEVYGYPTGDCGLEKTTTVMHANDAGFEPMPVDAGHELQQCDTRAGCIKVRYGVNNPDLPHEIEKRFLSSVGSKSGIIRS